MGGANDCCLSAALSNMAVAEQARLGKDCPFTVLATAFEYEIHSKAVNNEKSLASQLVIFFSLFYMSSICR